MLIWAYYFWVAIDSWISDSESQKLQRLKLFSVKWKHVMYMIAFLYSFHVCTKCLSATKNLTVHQAWQIYNKLFQHLENWYAETEQKIEWKNMITISINVTWDKFKKYYEDTNEKKNIFYAVMTVLNSCLQINVYELKHWIRNEQATYQQLILQFYVKHYKQYESDVQKQRSQMIAVEITFLTTDFEWLLMLMIYRIWIST